MNWAHSETFVGPSKTLHPLTESLTSKDLAYSTRSMPDKTFSFRLRKIWCSADDYILMINSLIEWSKVMIRHWFLWIWPPQKSRSDHIGLHNFIIYLYHHMSRTKRNAEFIDLLFVKFKSSTWWLRTCSMKYRLKTHKTAGEELLYASF